MPTPAKRGRPAGDNPPPPGEPRTMPQFLHQRTTPDYYGPGIPLIDYETFPHPYTGSPGRTCNPERAQRFTGNDTPPPGFVRVPAPTT